MKLTIARWSMRNAGLALRSSKSEAGCEMRDAGFGVRDSGCGIREYRTPPSSFFPPSAVLVSAPPRLCVKTSSSVPIRGEIPPPPNSRKFAVSNPQSPRISAFTLVELLVVIGILGLLIAILLPALNKMMQKSETASVKVDLGRITMAWGNYYREYGRWPVAPPGQQLFGSISVPPHQNAAEGQPGMQMLVAVMTNIMYPNAEFEGSGGTADMNHHPICTTYNPKRIQFMEFNSKAFNELGHLVDPWTNVYRFMFDINQDGRVVRGGTLATTVYASVIAWSLGPDGVLSSDDVKSWE